MYVRSGGSELGGVSSRVTSLWVTGLGLRLSSLRLPAEPSYLLTLEIYMSEVVPRPQVGACVGSQS